MPLLIVKFFPSTKFKYLNIIIIEMIVLLKTNWNTVKKIISQNKVHYDYK
jgi:hypothetical protein